MGVLWSVLGLVLVLAVALYLLFRRRKPALARPEILEWKATGKNASWQGLRYRQSGAPPVLLVHGYAGNTRNWRELGYALHSAGFDVWMANLRGHGKGTHRSSSTDGEGGYSFDAIAAQDFTELVNHVVSATGKKVSLIAHSMGGIAARAYLAGVRRQADGTFEVDADRAKLIAGEKVTSCVLMGSPPHFKNCSQAIRLLLKTPGPLVEWFHSIPLPDADTAPTTPDAKKAFGRLRDSAFSKLVGGLTANSVARGIVNITNFNPVTAELPRLMQKGISKVHVDLVRDVQRWMSHGDIHSRNGFDFSLARAIYVPMLFVAGEYDGLAHWEDVMAAADQHTAAPTWKILVRRTSHVDLIAGERAARLIAPPVAKFLENPYSLGSPGTRLEI